MKIGEDPVDLAWWEATRSSDNARIDAAWEELFNKYRAIVYGVAFRLVGNGAAAEDIVQDTFLQVHRYGGRFRGDSSVKAWILTIATNLGRRWILREAARRKITDEAPCTQESPSLAIDSLERAELSDRVQSAMTMLPVHQRLAVTLSCVEGLSGREIAQLMGCKEGTVWSRVYNAKRRLLDLVQESGIAMQGRGSEDAD